MIHHLGVVLLAITLVLSAGPLAAAPTQAPSRAAYKLGPNDLDWRRSVETFQTALDEAFRRTSVPKAQFQVGQDKHGKSFPVLPADLPTLEKEIERSAARLEAKHPKR